MVNNTGVVSKEQLTFIDKTIYSPKTVPLIARQLFSTIGIGQADVAYQYRVRKGKAKAKRYVNRGTDIAVVDETTEDSQVPITEFALAAEYSALELQRAQAGNVDLLGDQANLVARGMAEYEDRLIFNGQDSSNASTKITGLTSADAGFQTIASTKTFATSDPMTIRSFFQQAVGKITHLAGYASAKPVLLLPQARIDELNVPVNEYNPQITVLNMIAPWFSSVQAVPELEGRYWHAKNASAADKAKDMGIICVNTPDVAQIPLAMDLTRMATEVHNMVTKIPYLERMGGLAVRYPSAFVQLNGIN